MLKEKIQKHLVRVLMLKEILLLVLMEMQILRLPIQKAVELKHRENILMQKAIAHRHRTSLNMHKDSSTSLTEEHCIQLALV